MTALLKKLWNDESGQGLTEYALIIGLVSVALITILVGFRTEIASVFKQSTTELNNATVQQAT